MGVREKVAMSLPYVFPCNLQLIEEVVMYPKWNAQKY